MILIDRRATIAWLVGAAIAPWASVARAARGAASVDMSDRAVAQLKPGQFLWAPTIAPDGPMLILISLQAQQAFVYRNGALIGVSTVSSGKEGYETPTGIYILLQKARQHRSNLYSNAPMPFMQRLTWDGVAMHAGSLPGYPSSHGCIRLPPVFARQLFRATPLGMTIVVTGDGAVPAAVADAEIDSGRWQPNLALEGPVVIVISARDRKLMMLRDGVEIGRTAVEINEAVASTSAWILRAIDQDGHHWFPIPLPGQTVAPDRELLPEERRRFDLPADFRARMAPILAPGTILLLTDDSLKSSGAPRPVVVAAQGWGEVSQSQWSPAP